MDAKTIFNLLKPQLETMGEKERKSLSKLIVGKIASQTRRRKIMTVKEAKEKIKLFRAVEMQKEAKMG